MPLGNAGRTGALVIEI